MPPPPLPPPLPSVIADLSCIGCGYNLRTLPLNGLCPECGRQVSESIRIQTPWHQASFGRAIAIGVWLAFSSPFIFAIGMLIYRGGRNYIGAIGGADPMGARIWTVIIARMPSFSSRYDRAPMLMALLLVLLSYGLRIAATFLLTARPRTGGAPLSDDMPVLRWMARTAAMTPLAFLLMLIFFLAPSGSSLSDWRRPPMAFIPLALELPLPFLLWGYLASACRKTQMRKVRILCFIAPVLPTISLLLFAAAFGFNSNPCGISGVWLHAAGTFFSLTTLILLAIAIRRATRETYTPYQGHGFPVA